MRFVLALLVLLSIPVHAKPTVAIFAGGCFWCVEADFDNLPGVLETISGYDGGKEVNPSYKLVSFGKSNYVETVKVVYDSDKLSYQELLDYYWKHIDPTVKNKQFCDSGKQYRSVIFYLNEEQKTAALASLEKTKKRFPKVYTEVIPSTGFYPAEDYHQNYYTKNPIRYKFYRYTCGRDARLKEVWSVQTH